MVIAGSFVTAVDACRKAIFQRWKGTDCLGEVDRSSREVLPALVGSHGLASGDASAATLKASGGDECLTLIYTRETALSLLRRPVALNPAVNTCDGCHGLSRLPLGALAGSL